MEMCIILHTIMTVLMLNENIAEWLECLVSEAWLLAPDCKALHEGSDGDMDG